MKYAFGIAVCTAVATSMVAFIAAGSFASGLFLGFKSGAKENEPSTTATEVTTP